MNKKTRNLKKMWFITKFHDEQEANPRVSRNCSLLAQTSYFDCTLDSVRKNSLVSKK